MKGVVFPTDIVIDTCGLYQTNKSLLTNENSDNVFKDLEEAVKESKGECRTIIIDSI
ncbi:hypothetical protein ACWN8V_07005 [Vagococcus elongatus]|uniref:hypothetical protein n=1 Tax=Vagococcus elongatus TaxID=180344 RepID=UPI00147785FC|nr:hypothetical protein [Vagococcus elongatus]